jgi:hypothetical protein
VGVATGVLVVALGVGGWGLGGTTPVATAAPVAPAGPTDSTTTTTAPPPTTTTTAPPVTTTTVPSTTTTAPVPTTTTKPTTTTTIGPTNQPASKTTSSSTPWGLIVLIVVLVIAIGLVIVLWQSRKKRNVESSWRRLVVPALSDAQLARESLQSGNAVSDDPQMRVSVEVQVERAAVALERAVPGAPDPQAGGLATVAASALRGLAFAIEADRLLRQGTTAPTGVQLAQADEARRARTSELNSALADLSRRIGSPPGSRARR